MVSARRQSPINVLSRWLYFPNIRIFTEGWTQMTLGIVRCPIDSEQKRYHDFPLTGILFPKLLFVCALLFGGPCHHLSCRHRPEQPCYADSQHSSPEARETALTYPPRSLSYMRRRTKLQFRKSSWGMKVARSHIHAEWRASSSPADAGCAESNERSGWTAPRTG